MAHDIAWLDDDFLLVGNRVVNPEHYATVWTYTSISPWNEYGGRVWYIANAHRTPALTSSTLPTPAVRKEWAKASSEDRLVIRPGTEVSIDLQTADQYTDEVRRHITEMLTRQGLKIVPQSDVKLVGTIAPGQVRDVEYRTFGRGFRDTTKVSVQGLVATLSYEVKGEKVWQFQTQTGAPHFVRPKEGQSIADAAQSSAQLDSRAFERAWIPVTVPRPAADASGTTSASPAG